MNIRFAAKLSVVIDGGGRLLLDDLSADIRLTAIEAGWAIALGGTAGDAVPFAIVDAGDVVARTIGLLVRLSAYGHQARMRAIIAAHGIGAFGVPEEAPVPARRLPGEVIAIHPCADARFAIGIGLPFGQSDAATIETLCEAAERAGARDIRPAPGRALIVTGLGATALAGLRETARGLGLIVDPADPRHHIAACVGRPSCASARIDTRAIATAIAATAPGLATGDHALHVSGCEKGCAHPAPAALTLVGSDRGIGFVRRGTAASPAGDHLAEADLPGWIARQAQSRS